MRALTAGGPQIIGGVQVGTAGTGIYSGYKLAGGDDFGSLSYVKQHDPNGAYFPSHRRRGRRAINSASNDYYWTPDHTGYADGNRGVPVGTSDILAQSGSSVLLKTRLASAAEKAIDWDTTASTGPDRPQAAASIHSAGYQGVKWPCIVEARVKIPTPASGAGGMWPAFWMENMLPAWPATGEWDFEWIDTGALFPNYIISGGGFASNDATIASTIIANHTDGAFHTVTLKATASTLEFYVDGVLQATSSRRPDAAVTGPMFWWLRHGVDLTPNIFGMAYSAAAWAGKEPVMEVDWVRIWTQPSASDIGYKGVIQTVNVDFTGSFNVTLPSMTALWGGTGFTEYLVAQPFEDMAPGMSQVPTSTNYDNWYGTTPASNYAGPSIFTWNKTTRAFTGASFDRPGRAYLHLIAWDDTNGGLAGVARIVVNVGPNLTQTSTTFTPGASVSFDVYAIADCGMLTTDGTSKAKTISVTGLTGSGLSYNDSTGLLTGTYVSGSYTASITVTNSAGQSRTQSLGISDTPPSYAYEGWTSDGVGWFDISDAATLTLAGASVNAIANKRTGQGDLTGAGVARTLVSAAQNGRDVCAFTRDVSGNTARFSAASTSALSQAFQGDDKPYTVIAVYKPTDTNTGYIWSAADTVDATNAQQVALIRRSATAPSIRRQQAVTTNDVSWGSGQASGAWRIVAAKHTGTAVSVWDTSTTASVSGTAQNTIALNTELVFYIGAAESAGATDPSYSIPACAMDFAEIVVQNTARSDADIQQAITDLATKWGITLS